MNVVYQDLQELASPFNGTEVASPSALWTLLAQLPRRKPFMFELIDDKGAELLVGLSDDCGCAQYCVAGGTPPYLMAVSEESAGAEGFVEFLVGDTPTPIRRRYCLPLPLLKDVVAAFILTGTRSDIVT